MHQYGLIGNRIVAEDMEIILDTMLPWENFKGKVILVTGATGSSTVYFVLALCHANDLFGLGLKIFCLVRDVALANKKFGAYIGNSIHLLVQDVCLPLPIKLPRADFIVHAASPAGSKAFSEMPVGTIGANTIGTWNLLEFARRSQSQMFLFFSSGEVYGSTSSQEGIVKENSYGYLDPTQQRACYGEGKRAGEAMCTAWTAQYGLRTCSARLFGIYGPGMTLTDGRVIADFMTDALSDRPINVASDGKARRTYCYATDAVKAMLTLLLNESARGPYNIGNPESVMSITELANTFSSIREGYPNLGVKHPTESSEAVSTELGIRFPSVPDISHIRKLGWHPDISIREGLHRAYLAFKIERN